MDLEKEIATLFCAQCLDPCTTKRFYSYRCLCKEAITFTETQIQAIREATEENRMSEPTIPLGATCHYERIAGDWYVVWNADFIGGSFGRKLVSPQESLLLEAGYLYQSL